MDNGYYVKRRQRGYLINHYRYDINTWPEKYFFSLLLMFQPWRKIEELKNGYLYSIISRRKITFCGSIAVS